MWQQVNEELRSYASAERARVAVGFFKTYEGSYGESDVFIGVGVPQIRLLARKYYKIADFGLILRLLESKIHEERSLALFILVEQYRLSKTQEEKYIVVKFYIDHKKYVNNWDLVDLSAYKILGDFLFNYTKDYKILFDLANSDVVWDRRIAIVSTFVMIKNGYFAVIVALAKILLQDKHDLIRKAIGWMLREVGKKDLGVLLGFLRANYKDISAITRSYASERLSKEDKILLRSL